MIKYLDDEIKQMRAAAGNRDESSIWSILIPEFLRRFYEPEEGNKLLQFYVLPWPPSKNAIRTPYGYRKITTTIARIYYNNCALLLARQQQIGRYSTIKQSAAAWMEFTPPSNRPDIHNYQVAVYDALEKGNVIKNDRLIITGGYSKREPKKPGWVNVWIAPINPG